MASTQLIKELKEDVTCPICMEILKEPVIIDCGHNFCVQCISGVGGASDNFLLCPLCKASVNRRFQPNKLLGKFIEKIQAMEKEESELRCRKHNEKVLYFCEVDREFLCLVCRDSKDHKFHNVSLAEEAAQNYEEQIRAQSQVLGQKDKEVVEEKKQGEGTIDDSKAQMQIERLKSQEEFRCLKKNLEEEESFLLDRRKYLEEEESFRLGWLLWLEQEGDKLSAEQLNSLRKFTTMSLRAKQQMPPRDLLQDRKVTLSRTSTSSSQSLYRSQRFQFTNPTSVPVDLEKRINETISRNESTSESKKKLTGLCLSGENKAPVILNPTSADPELTLSQDLKTVSLALVHGGTGNKQAKPRSLDHYHWVLGSQGLYSGCQVWEVKLQGTDKGACVVGVATELAPGQHCLKHVWALLVSDWDCQPLTESSARESLPLLLRKVRVYLDRDHGKVIFFNPITEEQIYTFQEFFTGEVFPFFGLWNSGKISLIPQS